MFNSNQDASLPPLSEGGQTEESEVPTINSWEELRAYIQQTHDMTFDKDDPVTVAYSLHKVFLADYDRMLKRHNQAITSIIGTAIKGLTSEALAENLKHQARLADRTHVLFERQYKRAKLLSALNVGAAFVCALVVVYLFSN